MTSLDELQQRVGGRTLPLFFGGSFEPFHRGHKAIVRRLAQEFPAQTITLLPNRRSPLKQQQKSYAKTSAQKIFRMQAVLEDIKEEFPAIKLELELFELQYQGGGLAAFETPSYTSHTLKHLAPPAEAAMGEEKMHGFTCLFALGSDSFSSLEQWKNWPFLLETCFFVVFARKAAGGKPADSILHRAQYSILELDESDSSTELRELLQTPWENLKPAVRRQLKAVLGPRQLRYIRKHSLYSQANLS